MNPVNRLLIIDDDRALVNLLKRFLEGEGLSALTPPMIMPRA